MLALVLLAAATVMLDETRLVTRVAQSIPTNHRKSSVIEARSFLVSTVRSAASLLYWRSRRNFPLDVLHGPRRRGTSLREALDVLGIEGAPVDAAEPDDLNTVQPMMRVGAVEKRVGMLPPVWNRSISALQYWSTGPRGTAYGSAQACPG